MLPVPPGPCLADLDGEGQQGPTGALVHQGQGGSYERGHPLMTLGLRPERMAWSTRYREPPRGEEEVGEG